MAAATRHALTRREPFYERLAHYENAFPCSHYVPVRRDLFPEAYLWWQRRNAGAFPRNAARVRRLYWKAFEWAERNLAGFNRYVPEAARRYYTPMAALVRMFIVSEERELSFDFVLAHALLPGRDDCPILTSRGPFTEANEHTPLVGDRVMGVDTPVQRLREGRGLELDTAWINVLVFDDDTLERLDTTRRLRDACNARVPLEVSRGTVSELAVNEGMREPLRSGRYGDRFLVHVRYVDPFVMVVKVHSFPPDTEGRLVAEAAAKARHAEEHEAKANPANGLFTMRPFPQQGVGSFTEEDYLREDDMACVLLVRRRRRWEGQIENHRGQFVCYIHIDEKAPFNRGAMAELDAAPTQDELLAAFAHTTYPNDLLTEMAEAAGLPPGERPDRPPTGAKRRQ